jgi:hypothetical protein
MMNRAYIDAVRLLLEVAPEVFRDPVFASTQDVITRSQHA